MRVFQGEPGQPFFNDHSADNGYDHDPGNGNRLRIDDPLSAALEKFNSRHDQKNSDDQSPHSFYSAMSERMGLFLVFWSWTFCHPWIVFFTRNAVNRFNRDLQDLFNY